MSTQNVEQAQTVLSLGVQTDTMKQLKTCFYQEKDEVQEAIKKVASKNQRDYLLEYANYMFVSTLEKQYKTERVKFVSAQKHIIELMVKSGVKREVVLNTLGIEEAELLEATEKAPSKGAAKKLADIARLMA